MDYFDVIANRRSVRAYQPKPVEPEALARILEAANRAPSAGNLQAYEIVVVREAAARARLARAALGQDFVAEAPLALVFCADAWRSAAKYGDRGRSLYGIQDATIAATHALLAATALGLGSVWVGAFDDRAVAEVIGAPDHARPVAILSIGYPGESPRPTGRRDLKDLVREGVF
jgi:nitroreductase